MSEIIKSGYEGMGFTLELEDGSNMECLVLMTFKAGDKEYMALHPVDEEFEETDVIIFRFSDGEKGAELEDIEDEEEYDMAFEEFEELFDVLTEEEEEYEIIEESFGRE